MSVARPDATEAILGLARSAEHELRGRPGYRTELTRWTAVGSGTRDGVPVWAMGPKDRLLTMPVRQFAEVLPFPLPTAVRTPAGDPGPGHRRRHDLRSRPRGTGAAARASDRRLARPRHHPHQPAHGTGLHPGTADGRGSGAWPQMVLRVGYGRPVGVTPRRPLEETLLPSGGRTPSTAPRAGRSRRWAPADNPLSSADDGRFANPGRPARHTAHARTREAWLAPTEEVAFDRGRPARADTW